ncbi:Ras-related protein Ral-A [Schistosoma japonicum]|nr:Ras-related protein Ral-A [Schistosoma japonicum]
MSQSPVLLRISILGSGNVGKSCLTLQFMYDEFVEDYEPTKASSYVKSMTLDNFSCDVSIRDTAGQEDFAGVNENAYTFTDGFLIVFSLTDSDSFTEAERLLDRCATFQPDERVPRILVGNKVDLVDQIQVSKESAIEFANRWNIPYMETSAKTNHNVQEVFYRISKEIYLRKFVNNQPQYQLNKSNENNCCCIL